jgi:pimeloyl-ACP methyl ester carboxylesterase
VNLLSSAFERETLPSYPAWLDINEYPFAAHSFQTKHGRMHYLDEGEGEVIVMVHGTPTWSFLYRKLVKDLSKEYRCIVPDFLGFGLSDKPTTYSYTSEAQAELLETFISSLNLKNITLIVHDFGGPFGFHYAIKHPDNVSRFVVMNTWMWSLKTEATFRTLSQLARTPLGKFLFLQLAFETRVIMKRAISDTTKFPKHINQHYLKTFPDPQSLLSTLAYVKSFTDSDGFFTALWNEREATQQIPALILWGTKDTVLKEKMLERLETVFANRQVVCLENAGHFVQEEAGEECLPLIKAFLKNHSSLGSDRR